MAYNTRQDQPANRATSRPLKGFCRFIKGGTRCHHIINQQHRPIGDAVTRSCGWAKRLQIALSLAAAQSWPVLGQLLAASMLRGQICRFHFVGMKRNRHNQMVWFCQGGEMRL